MTDVQTYTFTATLWRWGERTSWYFLSLPDDVADDIADRFDHVAAGFGSIRVAVTIGTSQWETSLFPSKQEKTYVVPVKAPIRRAQKIEEGDVLSVTVRVGDVPPAVRR